jgi:hypothetical protein
MKRAVIVLALLAADAQAHDLRPGVLSFVEREPGDLGIRFVPPIDSRGEAIDLALVLPEGCARKGDRVRCTNGLGGELAVGGMRGHAMKIYVSLVRDGTRRDWVLTSEQPRIDLGKAPPATAHAKLQAGVHSFGGLAVAFAIALVVAFGATRRLWLGLALMTATSLVAGLAGFVAPITIAALSLLQLSSKKYSSEQLSWWLPGVFGIAHGVAGGAWFQVGIAGTRAVIVGLAAAAIYGLGRLVGPRRVVRERAHRAATYVLGALAAYWLLRGLAG